jgi:hypothetical protein
MPGAKQNSNRTAGNPLHKGMINFLAIAKIMALE